MLEVLYAGESESQARGAAVDHWDDASRGRTNFGNQASI